MSLLQMSFSGGVLILVVTIIRVLALNRLPKRAFFILWMVAALRLLVPVSIPSPVSVYSLAEPEIAGTVEAAVMESVRPAVHAPSPTVIPQPSAASSSSSSFRHSIPLWPVVWLTGSIVCAAFFVFSYARCRRKFRESLPAENPAAAEWLANCRLRRTVEIRQCGMVSTPLTYGIFHPVILLPKTADWGEQMAYVLEHELIHIQWFDAAWKLVLTAAVCVHWFNPLAWVMFVLANRDIELGCDETVVRRLGLEKKSAYAMALIGMEETKSGLPPLASGFSRNAIEERITAIMKMKKTSVIAVLLAAVLVCSISVGFATSAKEPEDLRKYLTTIYGFSKAESQRLLSLWFDGYEDMTVADYQEKLWAETDTVEDMNLIQRYSNNTTLSSYFNDEKGNQALQEYHDYFFNIYEPLTAEKWQSRDFSRSAVIDGTRDGLRRDQAAVNALLDYVYTMNITDASKLTVGEYEQAHKKVKDTMTALLWERTEEELKDAAYMDAFLDRETSALAGQLSTGGLQVQISFGFQPIEAQSQFSGNVAELWDNVLSPYTAFGLTYEFNDPDGDGNGLTMYYQGWEVRGICDEQENMWITEHAGNSTYTADAIELYAVYENSKLAGLRPATAEEQTVWDQIREQNRNSANTNSFADFFEEQREFPNATQEDYASFLELMKWESNGLPAYASEQYRDYQDMTLEAFNMRLLDWGNRNHDAYNRIMCDVIWDSYAVELSEAEKQFTALTSNLSGTENAMYVRSNYTGRAEEDPTFSENLPEWMTVVNSRTVAWCSLYYQCSYHIADKSAVTVRERDSCISGFQEEVRKFWQETEMDDLLRMTEEDIVSKLNSFAEENSTKSIRITPMTTDSIHFEAMDERGID